MCPLDKHKIRAGKGSEEKFLYFYMLMTFKSEKVGIVGHF